MKSPGESNPSNPDDRDSGWHSSSPEESKEPTRRIPPELGFQPDLVGYLLGALDAREEHAIEAALETCPELRDELQEIADAMMPLDGIEDQTPAPAGLARRTCEKVASLMPLADGPTSEEVSLTGPATKGSQSKSGGVSRIQAEIARRSFTPSELAVAAAACLVLGFMFFPAMANSRHQARIDACQNNLRQVGFGLHSYCEENRNYLSSPKTLGDLPVAGSFGPLLNDAGRIPDEQVLVCPASRLAEEEGPFTLPSYDELLLLSGDDAEFWMRRLGGSYAFPLGHMEKGSYHAYRNKQRKNFVFLSDALAVRDGEPISLSHAGYGQNVVCEDFSIRFIPAKVLRDKNSPLSIDSFYVNRNGVVAAGVDPFDSVVGSSEICPLVPCRNATP